MPQLGQVHIDRALTEISIQYANMMYVAPQVFPVLSVGKRSDKYFIYQRSMMVQGTALDANGNPLSFRRPGTLAAELNFDVSNTTYYAQEMAMAQLVTDAEVAYADNPLQPDTDATIFLTNRIALDNEIQVANLACKSTNYPTANKKLLVAGAGSALGDSGWGASGTQTNSSPFTNLKTAQLAIISSLFQEPNTLLLNKTSAFDLSVHSEYRDRYKYVNQAGVTARNLILPVVQALDVIEGGAQKATSAEGATLTTGAVWVDENATDIALVFYKGMETGPRTVHFGRTFEAPDDTTGARGFSVRRWRDEPRKGSKIEVSTLRTWQFIAVNGSSQSIAGYLISGVNL